MPIKSLMISKSGKWFVKPFLNELESAPNQQKMGNEKLVSYKRNYFLQLVPTHSAPISVKLMALSMYGET